MPSSRSLSPVQSISRVVTRRQSDRNLPCSRRLAQTQKAGAVPVEHLHLRRAAIDEDEQSAVQRILTEFLARQRVETVEGFAHVDRAAIDMHPDLAFGEEHQWRTRCRTRPSPRSSLRSIRGADDRRRTQRAQIDERRRLADDRGFAAIAYVAEQTAPPVQARCTDRFASAEGFNAQAATVKFRQQGSPLVPATPDPLPFFRSAIAVAPVCDSSREQFSSSRARREERRRVTGYLPRTKRTPTSCMSEWNSGEPSDGTSRAIQSSPTPASLKKSL